MIWCFIAQRCVILVVAAQNIVERKGLTVENVGLGDGGSRSFGLTVSSDKLHKQTQGTMDISSSASVLVG